MEHEITGHSRKVYKLWKNNDISPWKKIKEIGIEVLIIVFAVSFAAFIEREREHSTEQKEVKSFLLGIKLTCRKDIQEMQADEESYSGAAKAFKYLTSLPPGRKTEQGFVKKIPGIFVELNRPRTQRRPLPGF
jgi:hypothetical protein